MAVMNTAENSLRGVLGGAGYLRRRGDQKDAPVAERAWSHEVLDEPDPTRQLQLNARNARGVKERAGGLLGVLRGAAPTEPEIAELRGRVRREFSDDQRVIVESLAAKDALRDDVDTATDILWTLNHPDVWQLLVLERGWTPARFERWFADTTCARLLRTA